MNKALLVVMYVSGNPVSAFKPRSWPSSGLGPSYISKTAPLARFNCSTTSFTRADSRNTTRLHSPPFFMAFSSVKFNARVKFLPSILPTPHRSTSAARDADARTIGKQKQNKPVTDTFIAIAPQTVPKLLNEAKRQDPFRNWYHQNIQRGRLRVMANGTIIALTSSNVRIKTKARGKVNIHDDTNSIIWVNNLT